MPANTVVERVRSLVQTFLETDLMRLRIERDGGHVELRRRPRAPAAVGIAPEEHDDTLPEAQKDLDAIKSDLVGIFHFNRSVPTVGEMLDSNRELAYVEALGIRNPVRSLGAGRLAAICCDDGQAVEYGQTLFEIQRT